jgi:hypothetical protein
VDKLILFGLKRDSVALVTITIKTIIEITITFVLNHVGGLRRERILDISPGCSRHDHLVGDRATQCNGLIRNLAPQTASGAYCHDHDQNDHRDHAIT